MYKTHFVIHRKLHRVWREFASRNVEGIVRLVGLHRIMQITQRLDPVARSFPAFATHQGATTRTGNGKNQRVAGLCALLQNHRVLARARSSTEKSFQDMARAACMISATRAALGSPRLRHSTITATTMNGMPVKTPYNAYCRGISAHATIPIIKAIAPLTHHSVR